MRGGALRYAVVSAALFAALAALFVAVGLNRDTSIVVPASYWVFLQVHRGWRARGQARQRQEQDREQGR